MCHIGILLKLCHKVFLSSRLLQSHNTITMKCEKSSTKLLGHLFKKDLRTKHGRNFEKIAASCQTEMKNLTTKLIKNDMHYSKIPETELWREQVLNDLIMTRTNKFTVENFDNEEIEDFLIHVCTS